MRLLIVTILGIATPALADRVGGGGDGRLGHVSTGLAGATGGTSIQHASGNSGVASSNTECQDYRNARLNDPLYRVTLLDHACGLVLLPGVGHGVYRSAATNEPGASIEGFAGAEKVYGSDGSLTLGLSVVDQRFRLNGSFTQYYETEMSGAHIGMMAPELSVGVKLFGNDSTRVWLEGGVMVLKTSDPRGNSSATGPSVGARLEQRVTDQVALLGTAETAYLEDGIHAWAGRVGVRFHHVEAAVRILDLSVGPALYGPELGVGF